MLIYYLPCKKVTILYNSKSNHWLTTIINQQQPNIQFNTEHFWVEYNSLFFLPFQLFPGVQDFPGTSIGEGLDLLELRNDKELWKVALLKTGKGSLQRTGENHIFLLKRAVRNQGQVCSCTLGPKEAGQPSGAQTSWLSKTLFLNNKHIFRHEIGFLRFEHSYTLPLIKGTHCTFIWRWSCKMDGRNPNEFFHRALERVYPPQIGLYEIKQ